MAAGQTRRSQILFLGVGSSGGGNGGLVVVLVVGLKYNLWRQAPSSDKVSIAGLAKELAQLPKDPANP